ncbi:MAG: hypothetical protein EOL89_09285 [Actinobacteria bacterium]|nr:hypothetical protein [Actinomycetota bacterium]
MPAFPPAWGSPPRCGDTSSGGERNSNVGGGRRRRPPPQSRNGCGASRRRCGSGRCPACPRWTRSWWGCIVRCCPAGAPGTSGRTWPGTSTGARRRRCRPPGWCCWSGSRGVG